MWAHTTMTEMVMHAGTTWQPTIEQSMRVSVAASCHITLTLHVAVALKYIVHPCLIETIHLWPYVCNVCLPFYGVTQGWVRSHIRLFIGL